MATDARPARVRHDVRHPHGSIQVSAWHTSFPGELPLCSRCLTSGSAARAKQPQAQRPLRCGECGRERKRGQAGRVEGWEQSEGATLPDGPCFRTLWACGGLATVPGVLSQRWPSPVALSWGTSQRHLLLVSYFLLCFQIIIVENDGWSPCPLPDLTRSVF